MVKNNIHFCRSLSILLLLLAFSASLGANETGAGPTDFTEALRQQLITGDSLPIKPAPDWPKLRQIYHHYGNRLLWHDATGRIDVSGSSLYQFINAVPALGLEPHLYHQLNLDNPQLSPLQQSIRSDLLLTDAFLKLSRHLSQGQLTPEDVDPLWKIPQEQTDSLQLLDQAIINLNPVAVLNSLAPQPGGYHRLLQALESYQRMADQGGWPSLPEAPLIRPGERHDLIPLLRQRLTITGDLVPEAPTDSVIYDSLLQQSVERFQQSHGLKKDGIIGPNTRAALNVPVQQRIAQIQSNLERWRWLPQRLGDRYLLVNIGGYLVQLVEQDQVRLEKRTIIGRPMRTTPSFTTRATHVAVNPTWTVPRRIAVEDLLPEQRRDSEYLLRKNIQILQREGEFWVERDPAMFDWSQYNKYNFPFQLRQSPGDGNSLGRIKFHMPNPYTIYLHDTPAQGLFEHPVRDFSSGCVRVQNIHELVDELLSSGGPDAALSFNDQLESRESGYVKLPQPIDIFLIYFTVWVDTAGEIQFRPDIYNLDQPLLAGLQQLNRLREDKLAQRKADSFSLSE